MMVEMTTPGLARAHPLLARSETSPNSMADPLDIAAEPFEAACPRSAWLCDEWKASGSPFSPSARSQSIICGGVGASACGSAGILR